jgi:hypothetical protein
LKIRFARQPEQARPILKEITGMEPQMKDDPGYIQEAEELLENIDG